MQPTNERYICTLTTGSAILVSVTPGYPGVENLRTVPNSFSSLTRLVRLDIGHNQLDGTMPSSLGELTRLTKLYVLNNRFTGTIPASFRSLTSNMEEFILDDNFLTGNIDTIFCPRPNQFDTLRADCLGPNPKIICSCCTECR